jgi:hypothetical protein
MRFLPNQDYAPRFKKPAGGIPMPHYIREGKSCLRRRASPAGSDRR